MNSLAPLGAALADYIARSAMSPYSWKVGDKAWKALAGFDHEKYTKDLQRQNIELKLYLANCWATASVDEKIRIATWIVSNWGGIHRNTAMTILRYVNQADAERPATPFAGISSYSKILSIKDPDRYAIYDARVAASLNAIQLLLSQANKLQPPNLVAFAVPPGRNKAVKRFDLAFTARANGLGFTRIELDAIYGTYVTILLSISNAIHKSMLEVEMFLFAQADQLCVEALPLAKASVPG
jgi:hypothetical protein